MEILRSIDEMKTYSKKLHVDGRKIGFVPTMGYLHEGHLSLVKRSHQENDATVVSIFVNPIQFGKGEDLACYPRDEKRDLKMIEPFVSAVFVPDASEMYPEGFVTFVEVGELTNSLCGRFRPGHFRGVATVVLKLLNIVNPDMAYFGKKDYQQFRVIERMVRDLNLSVEIIPCEIIREQSGLAMSSRNVYLSDKENGDAAVIHKALLDGKNDVLNGEKYSSKVTNHIESLLRTAESLKKIDYVSVVNPYTLQDVDTIEDNVVILIAAYFGNARLIDNIEVDKPAHE